MLSAYGKNRGGLKPIVKDEGNTITTEKLSPEIEFSHVNFKYDEVGADILKDVSFKVNAGEVVALVGESSAGKTICISLLNRLWDVDEGSIRIGGIDVKDMKLHNLHDLTSVVLQEVYLFNATIMDNIRLSKPDAMLMEVVEVAKMARIHDFIESLPQGYDTVTGERGVQMSGGQRQRIAIARALLKDSPILILDEAVSNLDTKTDMEIQDTIRHLAHKKTILMVAHRLSTIMEADRLIVIRNGKVVQTGSHTQLLTKDGYYMELIAAQLS
ncbi:MAG: ATP-binding cassette domain-containing protein [Clostridiales bacterium]|jgi:ATP-binding cassette subfamily C protein CydC|nr:ATP-binding cassette domain-containing protein [Clostridiales bacterium]